MKEIKLTQGMVALVDDEDYDRVNQLSWRINRSGTNTLYACGCKTRKLHVRMHRYVLGLNDSKIFVDHIDGNGLNNQKSNLRACTPQQNMFNKLPNKGSSSCFIGVYKIKSGYNTHKWKAQLKISGKTLYLGVFPFTKEGEIMAAKRRDEAAKIHFGEFAKLNFPSTINQKTDEENH